MLEIEERGRLVDAAGLRRDVGLLGPSGVEMVDGREEESTPGEMGGPVLDTLAVVFSGVGTVAGAALAQMILQRLRRQPAPEEIIVRSTLAGEIHEVEIALDSAGDPTVRILIGGRLEQEGSEGNADVLSQELIRLESTVG